MSEMMFVDAVRRYLERLPDNSRGWLAGLRDRHVGRALALLHAEPARDWSIEGLAREVALSRSAFYDRFVDLIGQPPIQYLTQWRMQLAARLLRESRRRARSMRPASANRARRSHRSRSTSATNPKRRSRARSSGSRALRPRLGGASARGDDERSLSERVRYSRDDFF
jgi:AraC-like DNA-binding protein